MCIWKLIDTRDTSLLTFPEPSGHERDEMLDSQHGRCAQGFSTAVFKLMTSTPLCKEDRTNLTAGVLQTYSTLNKPNKKRYILARYVAIFSLSVYWESFDHW